MGISEDHLWLLLHHALSGDPSLLSEAHSWLRAHWDHEAAWSMASYYWPSHDNSAWAAALLLLNQTELQQHLLDAEAGQSSIPVPAASAALSHREALSLMWKGWLVGHVS
jgi:hypothetical protein